MIIKWKNLVHKSVAIGLIISIVILFTLSHYKAMLSAFYSKYYLVSLAGVCTSFFYSLFAQKKNRQITRIDFVWGVYLIFSIIGACVVGIESHSSKALISHLLFFSFPALIYPFFRFHERPVELLLRILFVLTLLVFLFTLSELISKNLFNFILFPFEGVEHVSLYGTRVHPLSALKFIRSKGVTGYPQSSSCLAAALSVVWLTQIFRTIYRPLKVPQVSLSESSIAFCISIMTLYSTGSGTGWVLFFAGATYIVLRLIFPVIKLRYWVTIIGLLIFVIVFFFFERGLALKSYYEIMWPPCAQMLNTFFSTFKPSYLLYYFLGGMFDGVSGLRSINLEVHLAHQILDLGLIAYVFLLGLLAYVIRCVAKTLDAPIFEFGLVCVILYLGSLHYECLFVVPSNYLFFACVGAIVGEMKKMNSSMLKETSEKRLILSVIDIKNKNKFMLLQAKLATGRVVCLFEFHCGDKNSLRELVASLRLKWSLQHLSLEVPGGETLELSDEEFFERIDNKICVFQIEQIPSKLISWLRDTGIFQETDTYNSFVRLDFVDRQRNLMIIVDKLSQPAVLEDLLCPGEARVV